MTKYQRKLREQRRVERQEGIADWKQHLNEMGFRSYEEYRLSDLWKGIRDRVLERDKRTCQGCGGTASHAHHRKYDREVMTGEDIQPIVALCAGCHTKVEFGQDGHKRTLYAAEIVYKTMVRHLKRKRR
jgi:5-methylcytosine-specific restriction endonuclease McrA